MVVVSMGSGISGLYLGTVGSSQPYAESYQVVEEIKNQDKNNPNVWSSKKGYRKNPLARNISECVKGNSIYYEGKKANGKMTYVVDMDDNLIFGKRFNPVNNDARSPHPMLIGGKNPKVKVAGMIEFRGGKIYSIDNNSGHYRPAKRSLQVAEEVLRKLPGTVFHRNSKWRQNE